MEEVPRGQAKHGTPTAPLQQETPDSDPSTLLVCPVQHWVPFAALLLASVRCYGMLCCVMLQHAFLWHAMLCYAMLCYAMLCYAMLSYGMLCYAMLCYATLRYC